MHEEISLNHIIQVLLSKWVLIVIVTILVAAIFCAYSLFLATPVYEAYGTLYISGDTDDIIQDANLSDLMLSQELAKTYGQILSSNTFFKEVAKESNLGYEYDQIQKMTVITNVEETGILAVSVSNPDPKVAYKLTNTILQLAPAELERVVVRGTATVIDPAELPEYPSSPNIPRNTVLGGLLGFIMISLLVFVLDLFDNTIKSVEDLERNFDIPVLGLVPRIVPKEEDAVPSAS